MPNRVYARIMRKFAVGAALLVAAMACGGGNAAQQILKAPEYHPGDQTKCHAGVSPTRPLIVEWPSPARGELEAIIEDHKSVAVVRYEGCTMTVLTECKAPGKISYVPYRNTKQDQVRITSADDLYANLPVGAASLEGKLQRAGELDVDMMLVGQYESDTANVTPSDLQGNCQGATHIVRTVTVGAFDFHTGANAHVGGGVNVMGAGAGGSSSAAEDSLARDGAVNACASAKPDDGDAPQNCGALVRLEVVPLAAAGAPPPVDPTKLVMTTARLANGLTLAIAEDHTVPKVMVAVRYGPAGADADPSGQLGMAHLFEHLLFATPLSDGRTALAAFQALGAEANASTRWNRVMMFATVPPDKLGAALAVESEQMRSLTAHLDSSVLEAEKAVVEHEIGNRIPSMDKALHAAYTGDVDARGTVAGVTAITLDDAKSFFDWRYGPRGAVAVIVGDTDMARARPLVERTLGAVPDRHCSFAGSRVTPTPIPLTGEVRISGPEPSNRVILSWQSPAFGAPGDAELDLAGMILGAPDTGRLARSLVSGTYVAKQVSANQESEVFGSLFVVEATFEATHRAEDITKAIDTEIAAVANGVPQADLDTARAAIMAILLRRGGGPAARIGIIDTCAALGFFAQTDTASCTDFLAARYAKVTPEDVSRAVKALLPPDRRIVYVGTPQPPPPNP
jgi:predicted Zn-dependent peptidase